MPTSIVLGIVAACLIAALAAPMLWLAWRHGRSKGRWPMSAHDTLLTVAMLVVLLVVLRFLSR